MKLRGLPNYQDLDLSGEARAAAERMEARAREPASAEMFSALVEPLLPREPGSRILEVGAGTGALARRIVAARPEARVFVTDKSEGMLAVARAQGGRGLEIAAWDVLQPGSFPFGDERFELILSSVMVPYLSDAQAEELIRDLSARLAPGGVLAFVEQDLQSDALHFPDFELFRKVMAKDERALKRTVALGLRPLLRAAGLELLPMAAHLWIDTSYGPYLQDVLGKFASDAEKAGKLTADERARWLQTLEQLRASGDFYYGLVYHRIAGRKDSGGKAR